MLKNGDEYRVTPGPLTLEPAAPMNYSNFEIRARLTNFTDFPLYIKTLHNIPIVIEPETNLAIPRENMRHLKIEISYTINDRASAAETLKLIDAIIANNLYCSSEAVLMRDEIKKQFEKRRTFDSTFKTTTLLVSRLIEYQEIIDAGIAFVPELALTVSRHREAMNKPHPYSPEGMENVEFSRVLENHGQSGVMVKVVDNDQLAPHRFFYSAKRLVRVDSIVDHRRESGVYVTTASLTGGRSVQFMSFTEAEDSVGLFKTQEEAMSHGDPMVLVANEDNRIKVMEKELNKEILRYKAEAAKAKQDYENIAAALANANLNRKAQYEATEYARKDYYENRSYSRKDESEAWKLIPLVIGVVVGIGGFIFGRR